MNICIFGDSITWGADDCAGGGWADRLKRHLADRDEGQVYNLGISGDTTTDLLRRFDVEAEARKPEMVIFAIGINDSKYLGSTARPRTDFASFQANINALVDMARKHTNRIVFVGLTRVDEAKTMPTSWNAETYFSNAQIETYETAIRSVCSEQELRYIAVSDVINPLEFADGLHPNETGHVRLFERVLTALETD